MIPSFFKTKNLEKKRTPNPKRNLHLDFFHIFPYFFPYIFPHVLEAFQRYDATGDGVLDVAELASALKALETRFCHRDFDGV